jgi:ribosomal protection tetracycline resistance protein
VATLNLGILAHVDAGKTTLTERLLHVAGVIDEVGRVDDGTTQTDTLALERQRGITIKSAVVSFVVDGVTINLVDTPGHPDFVAEVERVLGVLDGAVLVVSAVEGVQSQTLLLFRALRRLRVPTIVFVNKIDRVGADDRRVLDALAARLAVDVLAMGAPHDIGTRRAAFTAHPLDDPTFVAAATEVLAAHDDALLRDYVEGRPIGPGRLHRALAARVAQLHVLPVYFGAALTGIGVDAILHGIPMLLPSADRDASGPASGTVFKIERGPNREKVAFVRMFAGTLRMRERLRIGIEPQRAATVTGIDVFDRGTTERRPATRAGDIAKLHGLSTARIGDTFGPTARTAVRDAFAPPTLETAIVPRHPGDKRAVFAALADLAEQDPLIALRQDDSRQELFLSLYGEVQQEVVAQTLRGEYGLDIEFRPTTPVCVERPNGAATALELLPARRSPAHPFLATVGIAIAPRPPGSGVRFDLDVPVTTIPIHVFNSVDAFRDVMRRTVHDTLHQGLRGWEVVDCHVTMTDCDYQAPPRKWPGTTLSDYRLLTPLVLMAALRQAGTTVLEPVLEFHLELPADVLGPMMAVLVALDAQPGAPTTRGATIVVEGAIRVARVHELQSRLPALTSGEGVLETAFAGYQPVHGVPPSRPRTDRNPLDRTDYLRRVSPGN